MFLENLKKMQKGKIIFANNTKSFLLLFAFLGFTTIFSFLFLYKSIIPNVKPIRSDGAGYYSYLPSVFIYHNFGFIECEKEVGHNFGVWTDSQGHRINKYPVGVALLQTPFFIAVHLYKIIFRGVNPTGYERAYQFAVCFSAVVYFFIGILFLGKLLLCHFKSKTVFLALLLIIFGTNLFSYVTYDASFSHVYSFSVISIFLYVVEQFECKEDLENSFLFKIFIGFLVGLIAILRIPNFIVVLFYAFYRVNDLQTLKKRFKRIFHYKNLFPMLLGCVIAAIPQILYWYIATGKFIIRSYSEGETFSWFLPHIFPILFSMRKGLFFWSPVMFFSVIGFGFIKQEKLPYVSVLVCLLVHLWVTAAWDCWWYGGSFGARPFIDFYALYAFGLCLILKNIGYIGRVLVFCIGWGGVKSMLAYWCGVIPIDNATTADICKLFEWNCEQLRVFILSYHSAAWLLAIMIILFFVFIFHIFGGKNE